MRVTEECLGGSLSAMRNLPHLAFRSLEHPPKRTLLELRKLQLDPGKPGLAESWNVKGRKDWTDKLINFGFENRTKILCLSQAV